MTDDRPSELPPHAKRVFKGVIFDVWQWEQEQFDGTKATYERLWRPDSAVVLPTTPDKQIMLLNEEQPGREPFISLPAGKIEIGEKSEVAAHREFLEETGYRSEDVSPWFTYTPYQKIIWTVYFFIARDCKKFATPTLEGGEKIEPFFVTFDEFLKIVHEDTFRDKEVALHLLQIEHDPQKLAELKTLFFGS